MGGIVQRIYMGSNIIIGAWQRFQCTCEHFHIYFQLSLCRETTNVEKSILLIIFIWSMSLFGLFLIHFSFIIYWININLYWGVTFYSYTLRTQTQINQLGKMHLFWDESAPVYSNEGFSSTFDRSRIDFGQCQKGQWWMLLHVNWDHFHFQQVYRLLNN